MYRLLFVLFCAILICIGTPLYSQNLINWADPNEQKIENNSNYKILGIVGNRYYVLSERNRSKTLYTYSIDHKLISKQDYNVFDKKREYAVQNIVVTPRDTFFYIHELSQRHKEWVLYKCDYNDGQFSDPEEIYFERYDDISNKRLQDTYNQYEIYNRNNGGLIMSPDSSHIAFVNIIGTREHSQSEVVSVIVFDSAMNEKWRGSYDYDFSEKNIEIKAIQLSNNGIPHILAELQADLKYGKGVIPIKVKNLPRTKYYIYRVDQSGLLNQEVTIGKNLGIVDANMIFPDLNSNDYVIAGYYSNGDKNDRISGLFWCTGNPEMEIENIVTTPIDKELSDDMTYNFSVNHMLRMQNGNVGFVSEYYRVIIDNNFNRTSINRWNNFNNFGGVTNRYYSGDIVIPIFDSSGNVVKTNYIQRRFEITEDLFSNYALSESDNNFYIFYNTSKSRKEAKKLGLKGRIFTDMMTISKTGNMQYTATIISENDDRFLFSPSLMISNNRHSIMGGYDGNDLILAKILMN